MPVPGPRLKPPPPRAGAAVAALAAAGLAAALLGGVFVSAPAASAQEAAPAPPDRRQELDRIRTEIGRLRGEIGRLAERESGAAAELRRLDLELELAGERIAEARAAAAEAADRTETLEAEVARLGRELDTLRGELRRRLGGLYRLGRQGYLRLALSIEPRGDLLAAVRWLRFLVRRDAGAIDRFVAAREALEERRSALAAERRELEGWLERESARRRELAALHRRQETLVARLGGERRSLTARTEELVDRERKLAAFLDLLTGAQRGEVGGAPIQRFRGVLDWPAAGRVAVGFGPRRDPRYQTAVPHNGVEIATRAGGEVRAVYPGKVLFAAPFRGYGPTVVVHHPGRVFTLYAGLAELRVGTDAMVSLGDVVGIAADTLYFEIRVENLPENPLDWLR